MALSKKEKQALEYILLDLNKTKKYLLKSDTIVGRLHGSPYATSFANKDGNAIDPMNKEIGTDLCYLYNAIDRLTRLLHPEEIKTTIE